MLCFFFLTSISVEGGNFFLVWTASFLEQKEFGYFVSFCHFGLPTFVQRGKKKTHRKRRTGYAVKMKSVKNNWNKVISEKRWKGNSSKKIWYWDPWAAISASLVHIGTLFFSSPAVIICFEKAVVYSNNLNSFSWWLYYNYKAVNYPSNRIAAARPKARRPIHHEFGESLCCASDQLSRCLRLWKWSRFRDADFFFLDVEIVSFKHWGGPPHGWSETKLSEPLAFLCNEGK